MNSSVYPIYTNDTRRFESILISLEEFQELDSGWMLSCILNLTVNINKYNPLHAGCHIEFPREIKIKRVQSLGNACFAWSVIAVLHPAKKRRNDPSITAHRYEEKQARQSICMCRIRKIITWDILLIKDLFHLVSSQINKNEHKILLRSMCIYLIKN